MRETPISREAKTTVNKRPPKETFVQFRISLDEFASLSPITKQAVNEGKIKAPTISTLARASLITMANWKLRIDQANAEIKEDFNCKQSLAQAKFHTRIYKTFQ